jgi:peptidoglycan/xylan/chitin deacetylase (PgdA/CDA1 family)
MSLKNRISQEQSFLKIPRIQFLYIHHIFKDEEEKFEALLIKLSETHEFITYSNAVDKVLSGDIDKPYIVISSDDGFKSNLEAAKILDKYDIKACFFVNPLSIGLKEEAKIQEFCNKKLHFPATAFLDWKDLQNLMKSGHEIGSHTMTHLDIASSPIDLVESELQESFEAIKKECGLVKHFSYPFGQYKFFNKEAMELVFKLGYKSCASAERGCHPADLGKRDYDSLLLKRDHVVCAWDIGHILYFLIRNAKSRALPNHPY